MAEDLATFKRGAARAGRAGGQVAAAGGRAAAGGGQETLRAVRGAGWQSPTAARKLVLVSMLGLLAVAFYRARRPETDVNLFRRLWGVGVLGLMLSVVTDFAPSVGGPFALLVLLGSLTQGGDKALQNALANVGQRLPAGGPPARARTGAGTVTAR